MGLAATISVLGTACETDLGPCDEGAARTVVFLDTGGVDDGQPAYAGQALTQVSCGNGQFCHSPAAERGNRFGAPKQLDFDVRIACRGEEPCDEAEVERLRQNQRRVFEFSHAFARELDDGTMPPGEVGEQTVEGAPSYRMGADPASMALPPIDSAEGEAIVDNWLACGAPVVEVSIPPAGALQAGDLCNGERDVSVGDCIVSGAAEPVEPNWPSLFDQIVEPQCGRPCHTPDNETQFDASGMLDLSTESIAHDQLVGAEGEAAGTCDTSGQVYVVPGDPASSLLMEKIELPTSEQTCGQRMPIGVSLDDATIDAFRQWIQDGAPLGGGGGGTPDGGMGGVISDGGVPDAGM
jgi:hypothetical protein